MCPLSLRIEVTQSDGVVTAVDIVDAPKKCDGPKSKAERELLDYIRGERRYFEFPYRLRGTDFQKRVYEATRLIPYGETRSYAWVALKAGSPKAFRAVGQALNKNPLAIVVPCHRVIGKNGALVGFGGGVSLKQKLLAHERKHC